MLDEVLLSQLDLELGRVLLYAEIRELLESPRLDVTFADATQDGPQRRLGVLGAFVDTEVDNGGQGLGQHLGADPERIEELLSRSIVISRGGIGPRSSTWSVSPSVIMTFPPMVMVEGHGSWLRRLDLYG